MGLDAAHERLVAAVEVESVRAGRREAGLLHRLDVTQLFDRSTEQYPKGLGVTVPEVAEHLPDDLEPIEKVVFSAAEADGFDLDGRDQALVCGIETHVCVNQSVLDLLDRDVEVHVARDAVGSRSAENKELGLHKVEQAGAVLTSVETALFELVRQAGTDDFKQVQKVVLEYAP